MNINMTFIVEFFLSSFYVCPFVCQKLNKAKQSVPVIYIGRVVRLGGFGVWYDV